MKHAVGCVVGGHCRNGMEPYTQRKQPKDGPKDGATKAALESTRLLSHILALSAFHGVHQFIRVCKRFEEVILSQDFRRLLRRVEISRMQQTRVNLRADIEVAREELRVWREGHPCSDQQASGDNLRPIWEVGWSDFGAQRKEVMRVRPSTAQLHDSCGNMSFWAYSLCTTAPLMHVMFLEEAGADVNAADTLFCAEAFLVREWSFSSPRPALRAR
jgi:hypothetical protein